MSLSDDMDRLAREMGAAYDNRIAAVDAIHTMTERQRADLRAEHREMATAQRQELEQFAEKLRQNVANLLNDLDAERAMLSADQRRRLDTFTHDLRQTVASFLQEQAAERRALGASQRQSLADYRNTLKEQTSLFLADADMVQQAIQADHANAQRAWRQFNSAMRQRRSGAQR